MAALRSRNLRVVLVALVMIGGMTGLVAWSPTLYQMFCSLTGYGGTVQRGEPKSLSAGGTDETVTVFFNAMVSPELDWEFRPMQRKVETKIGEPTKVAYYARNNTDEMVIARATFNVTPYKSAPYFFKIECFCFTEEKLGPGESAEMPLVFYVDPQILKDENTQEVRQITLSYTFFRRSGLDAEAVEQARDLKAGSEALDARLEAQGQARFDNDAPRR